MWSEKCGGGFVCVYVKAVVGGPFMNVGEIWLYELLGLTVIGVRCCDCYVVSVCCELYVFRRVWNVRSIYVEEGRR